jgi:hypothetical protein
MSRHPRAARPFSTPLRALLALSLVVLHLPAADVALAEGVAADPTGTYAAKLTGSHVVPAVTTAAAGTARFVISGATITWQLSFTGSPAVTAAELDLGAIGVNGTPLFALPATGDASGTLSATDVLPAAGVTFEAALGAIASGSTYVTVRTTSAPTGEPRGQVVRVTSPPVATLSVGAPPAGSPARDDVFPRTLVVGQQSQVALVAFGQHTLTLLPAAATAAQDTTDPTLNVPRGCGTELNACTFDGSQPISVGPGGPTNDGRLTIAIAAPPGDYVVHDRLTASVAGILRVVPAGSFEVSSADDIALAIAAQLGPTIPPPPPPPPGTSVYSSLHGYDISYPDCTSRRFASIPPPLIDGFAIVGVNAGKMFRYNPCLAALWRWADEFSMRSLYINVNAAAGATLHQGKTGPAGTCASTKDHRCYGYNYGYNAARAAWRYAYHELGAANLPAIWWLDVEFGNTWYTDDKPANAASIQGALDFLGATGRFGAPSMGYTVGIYSTKHQYTTIAGTFKPGVPVWYATVEKVHSKTLNRCAAADWSFTGGPVWLVQYLPGRIDANVGCP